MVPISSIQLTGILVESCPCSFRACLFLSGQGLVPCPFHSPCPGSHHTMHADVHGRIHNLHLQNSILDTLHGHNHIHHILHELGFVTYPFFVVIDMVPLALLSA